MTEGEEVSGCGEREDGDGGVMVEPPMCGCDPPEVAAETSS